MWKAAPPFGRFKHKLAAQIGLTEAERTVLEIIEEEILSVDGGMSATLACTNKHTFIVYRFRMKLNGSFWEIKKSPGSLDLRIALVFFVLLRNFLHDLAGLFRLIHACGDVCLGDDTDQ